MWARLGKMVNITFGALGDLARNVSASAEEIKAKAADAKNTTVELPDMDLQAEAEKALGVAEVAALKPMTRCRRLRRRRMWLRTNYFARNHVSKTVRDTRKIS
ncbi:hypothetical protein ERJ75_001071000 [Trypanosoma vivax]|nr:hypothetical protein ERJ75_001071000 [Trypanosoma vivax]